MLQGSWESPVSRANSINQEQEVTFLQSDDGVDASAPGDPLTPSNGPLYVFLHVPGKLGFTKGQGQEHQSESGTDLFPEWCWCWLSPSGASMTPSNCPLVPFPACPQGSWEMPVHMANSINQQRDLTFFQSHDGVGSGPPGALMTPRNGPFCLPCMLQGSWDMPVGKPTASSRKGQ